MSANFIEMHGLCDTVKTINGNELAITNNAVELDLCTKLSADPDNYTRLMLSTGVGYEEVKITCVAGCLKMDPTPSATFMSGDKLWYESCSKANVADLMACIEDETADPADPTDTLAELGFKVEGYELQTNAAGEKCLVRTKEDVKFQAGKDVVSIDSAGCASVVGADPSTYPSEGTYEYATITVDNCGRITNIQANTAPVASCTGCCSSAKTQEVASAGVT